jgi:catalase-peroxidase
LKIVLKALEGIQSLFNSSQSEGKRISMADLIVLGGFAGVEKALINAGYNLKVPFIAGRPDPSQE